MPTTSLGASGVPLNYKLPGAYVSIQFGASVQGAGGARRTLLLIGNKTSAGTATVDTVRYELFGADYASSLFGEGSELHLMAKAAYKKQPTASIFAIASTSPAGTAASGTFTVVGTATGSGTVYVRIHGVKIPVSVISGNTVTQQAVSIRDAINGQSANLLVTATAAVGVVTVTHRHTGTRGNLVLVGYEADSSITGSTYAWSGTALTGGAGIESLTAALATAATNTHHYYVPANVEQTALVAVRDQLRTMAGPLVGRLQQLIYANVDTIGAATTIAEVMNDEASQQLWFRKSEQPSGVIAATWAAQRSVLEETNFSVNLSSFNPTAVDLGDLLTAPTTVGDWISDLEAASALDVGLTPIVVRSHDKRPYIPLSITTHSNDASNAPDIRTLTTNYVTVTHAFADEFRSWGPSSFPGMKLRADLQSGDDPMPPLTTTPKLIRDLWLARVRQLFENEGHINNLTVDYAGWAFNLVTGNPNRVNATMSITPAPWFTQISANVRQLTQSV